jgi:hypothetical protein
MFKERELALVMAREDESKLDGLIDGAAVIKRANLYLDFIQPRGICGADIDAAHKLSHASIELRLLL